jgi:D-cysteine desulfhydrase
MTILGGGSEQAAAHLTPAGLRKELSRFPKVLGPLLPTPLHYLPGISKRLGSEVWIKRDDLTGVAMGGNKSRKLSYLAADALRKRSDVLVSIGAHQSNHTRTVAAFAAMLGIECHLVLGGQPEQPSTGNLLLSEVFGATLSFAGTDDWETLGRIATHRVNELEEARRRPYLIPLGGSIPEGALAFVGAYLEMREQCEAIGLRPAAVVHATSSGGTQAGLQLARSLVGDSTRVIGIGVVKTSVDLAATVGALVEGTAALLNADPAPALDDICVLSGYVGTAYSVPTEQSHHWQEVLARSDGVLTDPAYTAKALAALPEVVDHTAGGPIVFWHTGGLPALFRRDGIEPR